MIDQSEKLPSSQESNKKLMNYETDAKRPEKEIGTETTKQYADNQERNTTEARNEALNNAISIEVNENTEKAPIDRPTQKHGPIGKKQLNESYKKTLKNIQDELPPGQRTFSKLIHNKAVEKISDIASQTIARPRAILSGAFTAFILTLSTYVMAKTTGYRLSGSETILSFVGGWTIGLLFDYLRIIITGKR